MSNTLYWISIVLGAAVLAGSLFLASERISVGYGEYRNAMWLVTATLLACLVTLGGVIWIGVSTKVRK